MSNEEEKGQQKIKNISENKELWNGEKQIEKLIAS